MNLQIVKHTIIKPSIVHNINTIFKVGETWGNSNTLNSSNQNQARVMKLNLQMRSMIISLSVVKEQFHLSRIL